MILIRIGDDFPREYGSSHQIEEGWVLQKITECRLEMAPCGIQIKICQDPINFIFESPIATIGGKERD
ncbi:hypothetical protein EDC39_101311 [Geothermobacter ehrlichii]|uniref:Uncharacterized protein n=1 Tax=Geothermobacter ehrlichii TaxID=213224 RepID=A0A5D3WMS2_9BACT|nr:hypothetical protein [Geothermobacter ehrlichii]TYP00151.1 hypothetical protein EDC39_101311 [Geothermobacter ehrlichii]